MTTRVGGVIADFVANTAAFDSNIKKAASNLNTNSAKMNRSLASIEKRVNGTIAAGRLLAGAFVGSQIVAAGARALDYAASLGETSQQLGVTSKDLQVYRYAASQVGIEQDTMDKGLQKLTATMGQAAVGAAAPKAAFDALSKVLGQDILKSAKTAGDAMPLIAEGLSKVADATKRAAIERALFGKAGQQFDTLLASGAAGINTLAEAAEKLGLVLSDKNIQSADETANKLSAMKQVLEANIARVVAQNSGAILNLANSLSNLAVGVAKFMATDPEKALGILGALAGISFGRAFGVIGAAAGGALGYELGSQKGASLKQGADDGNMDRRFRLQKLNQATAALKTAVPDDGGVFRLRGAGTLTKSEAVKEVQRQKALLQQSASAPVRSTSTPTGGGADLPDFLASGGGSGGASKIEAAKQKALQQEDHYQTAIARTQQEFLSLRESLTSDVREQAMYQHQAVDLDAAARERDLALSVSEKQISAAAAEQINLRESRNDELKHAVINRELDAKLEEQEVSLQTAHLSVDMDMLRSQEQLATTSIERKAIGLKLIDDEFKIERLTAEQVVNSKTASDQDRQEAQIRLDTLESRKAIARKLAEQANADPVQQFFTQNRPQGDLDLTQRQLEAIADKFNDLDQRTKAFADGFASAFGRAAQSVLDLKNPLDILRNLVTDLAAQFQQEFIIRPIEDFVRRKAGAPLAERLVSDKIDGKTVHGVAGDHGLNAKQMDVALQGNVTQLREHQSALMMDVTQLREFQSALAAANERLNTLGAGGAAGAGIPGLTIPSTVSALNGGGSSILTDYAPQGAMFDANQNYTGAYSAPLVDPVKLAAANDNLNLFGGATDKVTGALLAEIPGIGQFGGALQQVLSSLSGGGGGGGFLGSLLQIGGAIAGSLGGGGFPSGLSSAITGAGPIGDAFTLPDLQTGVPRFDTGGFTGPGSKLQPAGIVHAGEFVVTAEATRRLGVANLNTLNMPGYATGGLVGGASGPLSLNPIANNDVAHFGDAMREQQTLVARSTEALAAQIPTLDAFGNAVESARKGLGGGMGGSDGGIIPAHQTSAGLSGLAPLLALAGMAVTSGAIKFGGGLNAMGGTLGGSGAFAGLSSNITAAAPIGNALAPISLPGFDVGGFTGSMGHNAIAGVVHGGEFVMDADTTKRLGVDNLEALRRGDVPGFKRGGHVGSMPASQSVLDRNWKNLRPANERQAGNTFNVTVNGRMSERERRETGMQIAASAQREQSKSSRIGIAG